MDFITRVIVSRSQLYPWFSHTLWSHANCKKYDYLAVSITTLSSEHLAFLSASVGNVFSHRTTLIFTQFKLYDYYYLWGKKVVWFVYVFIVGEFSQQIRKGQSRLSLSCRKTCDIVAFCSLLEQDTIDSHLNCCLNKISSGCAMSPE